MHSTTSFTLPRRRRGGQSPAAEARYQAELDEFCTAILAMNSRLDFRVSSRGWCYVLENEAGLLKGDFDRAQDVINECRKSGRLPLDICAEDSAREFEGLEQLHEWGPARHASALLKQLQTGYERYTPSSFWEAQEYYLQLLVEKIDLKSLFSAICAEFRIPVANARGWCDINSRAAMMRRFADWEAQGKRPVLLYCGDFDPVGLQISDVLRHNLAELTGAIGWSPDNLIIDRFGLNIEFIEREGLTWIEGLATGSGKDLTDPNHPDLYKPHVQDYLRRYCVRDGTGRYVGRKVEANAMVIRPEPSRALLRETILRYLSPDTPIRYERELAPRREQVRMEVLRLLEEHQA